MTLVATLLLLGCLTATAGPAALGRLSWLPRAPRAGVAAWTLAVVALATSLLGAGVAALLPLLRKVGGLAELVHRCPQLFQAIGQQPTRLLAAAAGTLLIVAVIIALARSTLLRVWHLSTLIRRHRLLLIATGQPTRGVAVVPGTEPAAWALPGHSVVVTAAAVQALAPGELAAVVAHERAHLHGRHHLALLALRSIAAALPCRLTRAAVPAVAELLEMRADDVAAATAGRATVAAALLRVSGAVPDGALAAGGSTAQQRVGRLLAPATAPAWRSATTLAVELAAMLLPVALIWAAAGPVLALHFCPLPN